MFSGDTLFCGGPGATGRSYSDFPTIIDSIRRRLLGLPPQTVVHTGHGESTTIGAEAPHLEEWLARGALMRAGRDRGGFHRTHTPARSVGDGLVRKGSRGVGNERTGPDGHIGAGHGWG